MNCQICFSDIEENKLIEFPCSCKNCPSCTLEWISTSIQNKYAEEYIIIKCLNSNCNQSFLFTDIYNSLNSEHKAVINETLLVNYIRKNIDMRCCPDQSCNYAGFTEDKSCHSPLVCVRCNNQWFESAHRPKYNEYKNSLWEWLYTKKCPRCKVSIQKSHGCSHMTCEHCKFEFCWSCMQERFGTHSPLLCFFNRVQNLVMVLVAVFILLWLTDSHQYPLYAIDFTMDWTWRPMSTGGYQLFSYLVEFNFVYYILAFVVTNVMILAVGLTIIFSLDLTTIESYVGLSFSVVFSIGSSCLVYWWFFRTSLYIFAIELVITVIVNWRNETNETEAKTRPEDPEIKKRKNKKKKRGHSSKKSNNSKRNNLSKFEEIVKKL